MSAYDESIQRSREFDVITGRERKEWHGERIGDPSSDEVIVKIDPSTANEFPAVKAILLRGEEVAALWARLTDPESNQLLKEGQEVLAWVRVKKNGVFITKTAYCQTAQS